MKQQTSRRSNGRAAQSQHIFLDIPSASYRHHQCSSKLTAHGRARQHSRHRMLRSLSSTPHIFTMSQIFQTKMKHHREIKADLLKIRTIRLRESLCVCHSSYSTDSCLDEVVESVMVMLIWMTIQGVPWVMKIRKTRL